jgi:Flp pilus assembly protein TadB
MDSVTPRLTHPETAWLLYAVTPALAVLALVVLALLLRPRVALLIAQVRVRRARRALEALPAAARPDPALLWAPETIAAPRLAGWGIGLAGLIAGALSLLASPALALALGAPLAALAIWALAAGADRRYVAALDRELTGAVGRLGALLRAGSGLRPAIERVIADMAPGPLRAEWAFLLASQGLPVSGGGIATPQQVVIALADQTPSRRHATLLNHLGASVGQPQEVLARRCEAAYTALQLSDRRRDEALTELAQMRYSGIAVGLAGTIMATYLAWTQWERVLLAYRTPLGVIMGALVLAALALPIIGGALLTRVEDSDY